MKTWDRFAFLILLAITLCQTASAALPTAFTLYPTNISTNSATLNGSVNPGGLATTAFFEWGTTTNYGQTTSPQAMGSGSSPVAVQANLTSLLTDSNYHYRLVASNASGVVYGSNVIVTPTLLLYLYAGESWSYTFHDLPYAGIYQFPDTPQDRISFSYLPDSFALGSYIRLEVFSNSTNSPADVSIVTSNSTGGFFPFYPSQMWTDLQGSIRFTVLTGSVVVSGITFQRFENGSPRTQYGNGINPTKFPQPAALGTQFVSSVSVQSALISADINAKNLSTGVFVEWGTTTNYGSASGTVPVNFDYSVRRDITLNNLPPGTALHARVVATNGAGTTYGRDLAFTTPPPATVITLDANNLTSTAAVLNASVTLNGLATSAYFQWGTTTNYGQVTPLQNLGNSTSVTNISAALAGLSPFTSYHYRAVVFSSGVTNRGGDVAFSTPPRPGQFVVTNLATDDVRGAIEHGGLVTFAVDGALALNRQIEIANNVCLDATGHAITLSGSNVTRIFKVLPGITLTLTNITLANGRTNEGGAIYNEGTVIAQTCQFISNTAIGTNGINGANGADGTSSPTPSQVTDGQRGGDGGPGQNAAGGAIYNIGALDLAGCSFISNSVFGGKGGNGGRGGNAGRLSGPLGNGKAKNGGNGGFAGRAGNARGGSLASLGTLRVRDVTFSSSVSTGGAGGMGGGAGEMFGATSGVNVGDPAPTNGLNRAGTDGGASLGGCIFSMGNGIVSNCFLKMNDSQGGTGGEGGFFQTGQTQGPGGSGGLGGTAQGGGIHLGTNSIIVNTTFWLNRTVGGTGGLGARRSRSGKGGLASGAGGVAGDNSAIINSTFATNSAVGGEAGAAVYTGFVDILGGNGGDSFGGGLVGNGNSFVTNVTMAGNSAIRGVTNETNLFGGSFPSNLRGTNGSGYGGSLANTGGVFQIVNSILMGGISNNCFGAITDLGHNISSDATPVWTSGTSVNNTDALLQPLADYGGPTLTMALAPGSPALSNADPAASPATDQRGVARPLGGGYDIGAFEGPYTPPLFVLRGGGSTLTLRWAAYAGQTYRVEASSTLTSWSPFATNTASTNGWLDVPVSATLPLRFFRLFSE